MYQKLKYTDFTMVLIFKLTSIDLKYLVEFEKQNVLRFFLFR